MFMIVDISGVEERCRLKELKFLFIEIGNLISYLSEFEDYQLFEEFKNKVIVSISFGKNSFVNMDNERLQKNRK